MAGALSLTVNLSGPMFTKDIKRTVEEALAHEILSKVEERMERSARSGGKKALGRRRNTVSQTSSGLTLTIDTTLKPPRVTGSSWQSKNTGIILAMSKNVARKAANRIIEELS